MNNLMKITAIAGVAILSSCIGDINAGDIGIGNNNNNGGNNNGSSSPNSMNENNSDLFLSSSFTTRAVTIGNLPNNQRQTQLLQTLGKEYLESITGRVGIFDTVTAYFLAGTDTFLTPDDGIFMAFNDSLLNSRVAVGIYDTTDVGAPLTRANATVIFTGGYTAQVVGTAYIFSEPAVVFNDSITLTADFNAGTFKGTGRNTNSGALLIVDGGFSGTALSGSVNFTPSNSNRSYESPLTGLIGQSGAVGTFMNNNREYAFGGGFLVERNSQ